MRRGKGVRGTVEKSTESLDEYPDATDHNAEGQYDRLKEKQNRHSISVEVATTFDVIDHVDILVQLRESLYWIIQHNVAVYNLTLFSRDTCKIMDV
jgi:hypothetical protein